MSSGACLFSLAPAPNPGIITESSLCFTPYIQFVSKCSLVRPVLSFHPLATTLVQPPPSRPWPPATASSLAFLCSFFPLQSILHPAAGVVFKHNHQSMVLPCCDPSHSFPRQLGRTDQGCGSSSWCQPCSFHLWHTGLSAPHMCPVCSCLRVFMLCAWEALL